MFTFTIDEDNTVKGFVAGQDVPVLLQPQHPTGVAWSSRDAAEEWANAWLAHMQDPDNNEFPA